MNLLSYIQSKINFILLFFLLVILSYRLLICINYNPEISVGETNNVWNALNVANGKPLYSNPEDTPFEIFQYTPLSQLPVIAAAQLFNSHSDKYAYYVMVTGRITSLVFNLLTFYLVYLILKNSLQVSNILSFTAAISGFGLLTHLSFAVRPDAMALFLTIASVYLFSKAFFQKHHSYYLYSGFAFAFSFFAKQDAFSILSAIGLFLFMDKNWKALFMLALSFLISWTLLLFAFKLIFGKYFLFSIIGGLAQGYDSENAQTVFLRFFTLYSFLFLTGLATFMISLREMLKEKSLLLLTLLMFISFLIAMITSVKMGSWVNYYTPFMIYTICLIFYYIDYLIKNNGYKIPESFIVIVVVAYTSFFIYRQLFHYTSPFIKYNESKTMYNEVTGRFKDFKKDVEGKNYKVFSFDKRIKLLLFKNTIFPNTEYYHHTLFSYEGYNKLTKTEQLKYYIVDAKLNNEQLSALTYFKVPMASFVEEKKIMNYIIFEDKP